VVEKWVSGDPVSLNIANRTIPQEVTGNSTALISCACYSGIPPEALLKASVSFHRLTAGILSKNASLVDPEKQGARVRANDPQNTMGQGKTAEDAVGNGFANGLFSLSEIAFDNEHKHAIVRFSFVCGSLCGSGTTALFEKVGGEWKPIDRTCGGWVS